MQDVKVTIVLPTNALNASVPEQGTPQNAYEPELGQMMFGNDFGEFDLGENRRYVAETLYALSEKLGKKNSDAQAHGCLGGMWGYGQDFESETFEMHPYWWGGCNCGFERKQETWLADHDHADECFYTLLDKEGQRLLEEQKHVSNGGAFDGELLLRQVEEWANANRSPSAPDWPELRDYCDCGFSEVLRKWLEENDHSENCPEHPDNTRAHLPNFSCGDVEIRWYKYIGRGMSVNREVSRGEWEALFARCFASLG